MKTNLFIILVFCAFSGSLFAQASTIDETNSFTAIEQPIQNGKKQSNPKKKEVKAPGTKHLEEAKTKKNINPKVKSTPGHSHLARNRYLRTNHIKGKE